MQRALVLAVLWSAPVVSVSMTPSFATSSSPAPATTHAIARAAAGEAVTIPTGDRLTLSGTFYSPRKKKGLAPAVLLVHDAGADRGQLDAIAARLQKTGFGVLTVDLRGHGESKTSSVDWNSLDEEQRARLWQLAPRDIEASAEWLLKQKGMHATRLSLVGYRSGCALVTRHAEQDENVIGMVLLAPKAHDMGFDVEQTMHNISGLPTCILDQKNAETTRLIDEANASASTPWVEFMAVPNKKSTVLEYSKTPSKVSTWLSDIALPKKGRK